jgi:hypothetical protein
MWWVPLKTIVKFLDSLRIFAKNAGEYYVPMCNYVGGSSNAIDKLHN